MGRESALRCIEGVEVGGRVEADTAVVVRVVGEHFAQRWGGDDAVAWWALLQTALAADGQMPSWIAQDVAEAAAALRRSHVVDAGGCVRQRCSWQRSRHPRPRQRRCFILCRRLLSCRCAPFMLVLVASGRPIRQLSRCVLLPQCSTMGVIDVLLSRMVHALVDSPPALPRSVAEGCRPGVSAGDLALSARLVVQHALDRRSEGAVGQGDIKHFYDHVPVPKCVEQLRVHGLPATICAAVIRHQMLPAVDLRVGPFRGLRFEPGRRGA